MPPSPPIFRQLKKNPNIQYLSSDWVGELMADQSQDITAIEEKDEPFDFIICFLVLKHVKTMPLTSGNFIQTHLKAKRFKRILQLNPNPKGSPYFGQAEDAHIYFVKGLESRLKKAGF